MRYNTLCIGLFFLVLAGGMSWITFNDADAPVMDMLSPHRITYIFLGLLGGFGALLVITGVKEAMKGDIVLKNAGRLAAFFLITVLYVLALSYAGHYVFITPLMLFACMMLLKVRYVPAALVAIVFSVSVYLVFHTLLGVPLP